MTAPEATVTTRTDDPIAIYGRAFDAGLNSGRRNAGNDEIFSLVADATLTCLVDETAPEHVREKSYANLIGFCTGWSEMMLVTPLQFLTREQTARVQSLPRGVRRAWTAEYERGVKHWVKGGGTLSGKRPVLPEIP